MKTWLTPAFSIRILLDCAALIIFITCLAYYWLGNVVHEWLGLLLFCIGIIHNFINRHWFRRLPQHTKKTRSLLFLLLNTCFLLTMIVLLISSVVLSRTVLPWFTDSANYLTRDIHVTAAYWAFILMSLHVGMSSQKIVAWAKKRLNYHPKNSLLIQCMAGVIAAGIAFQGLSSASTLIIKERLTMTPTLFMWDFTQPSGYLLHHLAVFAMIVIVTYYSLVFLKKIAKR